MNRRDKAPIFSSDQMAKILSWMKEKGDDFKCPVCKHDHFTVNNHLIVGIIHGKEVFMGPKHYPLILAHCDNCHASFHFMAMPILGESITEDMIWEEDDG